MPLISRFPVSANDPITAAKYNTDIDTVYDLVNGSLDRANIKTRRILVTLSHTFVIPMESQNAVVPFALPVIAPFTSAALVGVSISRCSIGNEEQLYFDIEAPGLWSEVVVLPESAHWQKASFAAASHALPFTEPQLRVRMRPATGYIDQWEMVTVNLFILGVLVSDEEV